MDTISELFVWNIFCRIPRIYLDKISLKFDSYSHHNNDISVDLVVEFRLKVHETHTEKVLIDIRVTFDL